MKAKVRNRPKETIYKSTRSKAPELFLKNVLGKGKGMYYRSIKYLSITIGYLPIYPCCNNAMRESIPLQRRPATFTQDTVMCYRCCLIWVYKY